MEIVVAVCAIVAVAGVVVTVGKINKKTKGCWGGLGWVGVGLVLV